MEPVDWKVRFESTERELSGVKDSLQRLTEMMTTLVAAQQPIQLEAPLTPTDDKDTDFDRLDEKASADPSSPIMTNRSLLPSLSSPVSASQNTVNMATGTRITKPLPRIVNPPPLCRRYRLGEKEEDGIPSEGDDEASIF